MKRDLCPLGLLLVCAVAWFAMNRPGSEDASDEIEYRGERFKLSKAYSDYDDYKDDPNNIHISERARVKHAVMQAKVSLEYRSQKEMVGAMFDLSFPGYGLTTFGEKTQSDGSVLAAFAVEIPGADKDRVLVFQSRGGPFSLIDDFVVAADMAIMQVRLQGEKLVYSTPAGKQRLVRALVRQ
jgi:hypothetical protein